MSERLKLNKQLTVELPAECMYAVAVVLTYGWYGIAIITFDHTTDQFNNITNDCRWKCELKSDEGQWERHAMNYLSGENYMYFYISLNASLYQFIYVNMQ